MYPYFSIWMNRLRNQGSPIFLPTSWTYPLSPIFRHFLSQSLLLSVHLWTSHRQDYCDDLQNWSSFSILFSLQMMLHSAPLIPTILLIYTILQLLLISESPHIDICLKNTFSVSNPRSSTVCVSPRDTSQCRTFHPALLLTYTVLPTTTDRYQSPTRPLKPPTNVLPGMSLL